MKAYSKLNTLTAILLCTTSLQFTYAANAIKPLNSIAAEVNGSIITYGDIERTANLMRQSADKNVSEQQLAQAARQALLERALLADAAKNQGLKVNAAEIDTEIARRAQLAKTTIDNIYADAAHLGWSKSQYRFEVAKDLLLERITASIEDDIKITDHQIDAYIAQAKQDGQVLPTGTPYTVYKVRRIVLNINKNNTASSVGERMRLIAQAIQQGGNISELARRYSQDISANNDGISEITDRTLPSKAEDLLHQLQPNQITIPIQTNTNWQMIQLIEKHTETDPTKMQREAVRIRLLQQAQQQAQQQFIGQLQQNAVVREY